MLNYFIDLLKGVSPELATFFIAMLPIAELRGAIPLGLGLKLSIQKTYLISVVGNLLPIVPILLCIGFFADRLRKYPLFDRFFIWLFNRTRKRSKIIEKLELLGLVLFVAIPLPFTGAWTGAVAAFLFDFPFRKSFPAILCGVMIAGIIVTLASLGLINFIGIAGRSAVW